MSLLESFATDLFSRVQVPETTLTGRCSVCYVSMRKCSSGGYAPESDCDRCALPVCKNCTEQKIFEKTKLSANLCRFCADKFRCSEMERSKLAKFVQLRSAPVKRKRANKDASSEAGTGDDAADDQVVRARRRVSASRDIFGAASIDDRSVPVQSTIPSLASPMSSDVPDEIDQEDTVAVASLPWDRRFTVRHTHASTSSTDGLETHGLALRSSFPHEHAIRSAFERLLQGGNERNGVRTYASRRRRAE